MLGVRDAAPEELVQIMKIYECAQDYMIRNGNPTQWGRSYPGIELIRSDIEKKLCKVVYDAQGIHGVFALLKDGEPDYDDIEGGQWLNDDPYLTIHRVASDGQVHGIFRCIVEYCSRISGNIRIDTHADNLTMQSCIEKNGFTKCGVIYVEDGTPRFAYQRAEKKSTKPLPIGVSDFKTATENYYYVDKTLLIRDFLDMKPMVSLFTRPRRFGKTLNMDMLRLFFEKTDADTSVYFRDKKIWHSGEVYTQHQGKYPVIFLTFKDVKCQTWKETLQKIQSLISLEFMRHDELESSSVLSIHEKERYHRFVGETISEVDCQMGLQILSLLLHKHYGKECVIIIDEYDTPIQQGHSCDFYSEIINFMRNFFSGGLKDNPHLAFGFLTGILRVAKEGIFSGMNNLKVNSILDENYSEYFGFTKEEVKGILRYYGSEEKYQEICDWYDGYKFGDTEIFNPWSVINYVSDKCFPKAFWQSTGSNEIIGEIISSATLEITEGLYKLLSGEKLTTYIDTSVIYPEVQKNPYSIYSFLLVAGYLKVAKVYPQNDGNYMCDVAIPNKEIAFVYEKEILNRTRQNDMSISINQAIFSGDAQKLQTMLENFMLNSISSMDSANEGFYHGMMLGLCAVLGNRYQIRSNRESGMGRFDVQLAPLTKGLPGFLFEFKHTNDAKADLEALADKALRQIEEKQYDTELRNAGVAPIVKIGIAFRGKNAVVKESGD